MTNAIDRFSAGELLHYGASATRSVYRNMPSSSLSPCPEFHPPENLAKLSVSHDTNCDIIFT